MKYTITKKAARLACAFALAASLAVMGVGTAFADPVDANNQGKTIVTLEADDSAQLTATVPTALPAVINGDGTLTYPTDFKITNGSIFDIHVASIGVVAESNFNLVDNTAFSGASGSNTLWSQVTAGATVVDLTSAGYTATGTNWNIDANDGSDDGELALSFAGAIKDVNPALTQSAATAYTITWTVAAGTLS